MSLYYFLVTIVLIICAAIFIVHKTKINTFWINLLRYFDFIHIGLIFLSIYVLGSYTPYYLITYSKNILKRSSIYLIKLCQWYAIMLNNIHLKNIMNELQESCNQHEIRYTEDIIGKRDVSINHEPISSASISQVYKGTYNNHDVAIKVKHPNVEEQIIADYYKISLLINTFNRIICIFNKNYKVPIDLKYIYNCVIKETNFKDEASNLKYFRKIFKHTNIIVPEVYDYTNEYIIMSYCDGRRFDDYYKVASTTDIKRVVNLVFTTFLHSSVVYHCAHGDFHQGNWKINNNNTIILYDFGSIIKINNNKIASMLISLILNDMIHEVVDILIVESNKILSSDLEYEKLFNDISDFKKTLFGGMDVVHIMKILFKYGIVVGDDFYLFIKNITILEKYSNIYLVNTNLQNRQQQLNLLITDIYDFCLNTYNCKKSDKRILLDFLKYHIRNISIGSELDTLFDDFYNVFFGTYESDNNERYTVKTLINGLFAICYSNGLDIKVFIEECHKLLKVLKHKDFANIISLLRDLVINKYGIFHVKMKIMNYIIINKNHFTEHIDYINKKSHRSFFNIVINELIKLKNLEKFGNIVNNIIYRVSNQVYNIVNLIDYVLD